LGKKQRVANAERRARRDAETVDLLRRAALAVGLFFGEERECLEGAALFTAIARALGHQARPQSVHTIALRNSPGSDATTILCTSTQAGRHLIREQLGHPDWTEEILNGMEVDGWAGHMVVVTTDPAGVFDPTFSQFRHKGMPNLVVGIAVAEARPAIGYWEIWEGDTYIRYVLSDADAEHIATCDTLTLAWTEWAEVIASQLRAGVPPERIRWPMPWAQFRNVDTVRDYS
jgi:hypothetical protein